MKMLEMITTLSGSYNYTDKDVQAVHELLGIPYEVADEDSLDQFLPSANYGLIAVKFDNGATCFGFTNYAANIPTQKTLDQVSKMAGVTRVAYFSKTGSSKFAGRM